jgi:hypothetical protein
MFVYVTMALFHVAKMAPTLEVESVVAMMKSALVAAVNKYNAPITPPGMVAHANATSEDIPLIANHLTASKTIRRTRIFTLSIIGTSNTLTIQAIRFHRINTVANVFQY